MKTINNWTDLTAYGIDALTGEACGLSYRILCDVTAKGKAILAKCLGTPDFCTAENWNRGTDKAPHIGSVMLVQEMLTPLGVFALLESGCIEVWLYKNGSLRGIERSDPQEEVEIWREFGKKDFCRGFTYGGTARDRHVHCMTGRVE